jgi:hypothetical protein
VEVSKHDGYLVTWKRVGGLDEHLLVEPKLFDYFQYYLLLISWAAANVLLLFLGRT